MAFGFGLARVEEGDFAREILLENRDELRSEGDFGNEKDDGFLLSKGI